MLLGLHHAANVPVLGRTLSPQKLVGPLKVMANAGVEYMVAGRFEPCSLNGRQFSLRFCRHPFAVIW